MATSDAVKHQIKVIEELVITERTYINGLRNLITYFMDPLESRSSILCNKDYQIIFPNIIKTIYNLHQTLFTEFQREFKLAKTTNESSVGKIFIDHSQIFKMYQNYNNNHHKATQKLIELSKNKKVCNYAHKDTYLILKISTHM